MHSRINMNISLLGGGTELIVHEVTPRKESRIRTFLTWGGGTRYYIACFYSQRCGWCFGDVLKVGFWPEPKSFTAYLSFLERVGLSSWQSVSKAKFGK